MKKQLPFVAFSLALLALNSCASLEHLTDDRTRLEDDEMYWNGQELFYSPIAANADPFVLGEDDYYNPNAVPNANQLNGGRNPNAFWSPNLGWQLSYGLSPFSNYYNGFNSYGSYGYGNSYYSPWGYSTYNPYGSSWGYNPNGYLSYGGFGSGFGWGGYNPYYGGGYNGGGWGSGWNNNSGSNETGTSVTHIHRNPISVGLSNGSGYHGGRLQKQIVTGLTLESKEPVSSFQIAGRSAGVVGGKTTEYNAGREFSNGVNYEDDYHTGSRNTGNNGGYNTNSNNTQTYSSGSHSNGGSPNRGNSSPSYSAPSRSNSSPSHSAPSRSNSSPSRSGGGGGGGSPSKGGGSPSKGGGRK